MKNWHGSCLNIVQRRKKVREIQEGYKLFGTERDSSQSTKNGFTANTQRFN